MKKTLRQQLTEALAELELTKSERDDYKTQLSTILQQKDKEMKNILVMLGRQFGLSVNKHVPTSFGMSKEEPKTVPEIAGEVAGIMGQLLEDKRVADARSEEREKEVSWLRGTFHLVLGIEEKVEISGGETKYELEKPTKL